MIYKERDIMNMERLERISAEDHETMYEIGWKVFGDTLKQFKEQKLDALTMLAMEEVSEPLILEIVDTFIESSGPYDWTEDDAENYNIYIYQITKHAEILFHTMLHDYKWYLEYNCKNKIDYDASC